jgi:hypothetical protein
LTSDRNGINFDYDDYLSSNDEMDEDYIQAAETVRKLAENPNDLDLDDNDIIKFNDNNNTDDYEDQENSLNENDLHNFIQNRKKTFKTNDNNLNSFEEQQQLLNASYANLMNKINMSSDDEQLTQWRQELEQRFATDSAP